MIMAIMVFWIEKTTIMMIIKQKQNYVIYFLIY